MNDSEIDVPWNDRFAVVEKAIGGGASSVAISSQGPYAIDGRGMFTPAVAKIAIDPPAQPK